MSSSNVPGKSGSCLRYFQIVLSGKKTSEKNGVNVNLECSREGFAGKKSKKPKYDEHYAAFSALEYSGHSGWEFQIVILIADAACGAAAGPGEGGDTSAAAVSAGAGAAPGGGGSKAARSSLPMRANASIGHLAAGGPRGARLDPSPPLSSVKGAEALLGSDEKWKHDGPKQERE